MSELSLLLFRKSRCGIVVPRIRQYRRSIRNRDIDNSQERENIYDDHDVADRCEMEQARQAPLASQIVFGLVEEHSIRLANFARVLENLLTACRLHSLTLYS